MTEPTVEERIRAKAHELWESEGRPEGQQERHWQLARQMIEDADGTEHELDEGSIWRPEADGLNPIQGSSDASESRVNPLPSEKRPQD
jgi:Protein of unknown function (DUF2934)